jgi:hypothetical protein
MNRVNKSLAATFLSAVMLFTSVAQAMEIRQFDNMADRDQAEYVGLLVQGAEKELIGQGRTDLAAKIDQLFTKTPPGDRMPLGMTEFEINLALLRLADAKNAENNPNDPRVEVEDVMAITLEKNGTKLPDSFFAVAKHFKPKFPPQDTKN